MNVVVFTLREKEYGIDIRKVRQVIRMKEVIPIPEAAAYVEGVISLRGKIIPLVSLCKKFGLPATDRKNWNRIIVVEINAHPVGILVDRVTRVEAVDAACVTQPDQVLKDAAYLEGVVKIGPRVMLLVDIVNVFSGEENAAIRRVPERVEVRRRHV